MNDVSNLENTVSNPQTPRNQSWLWLAMGFFILAGIALIVLGFWRDYQLVIDGKTYQTKAIVFRAGSLLKQSGLSIGANDLVSTDLHTFSLNVPHTITIKRARKVKVMDGSNIQQLNTAETFPIDLMHLAGKDIFPNDLILQNGKPIDPYKALPLGQEAVLEYRPAKIIHLTDQGRERTFSSQLNTLAEALSEQNIAVGEHDRISLPLDTALAPSNEVNIRRAHRVVAWLEGTSFDGYSVADNAEEALLDIGIPIQNLDYLLEDTSRLKQGNPSDTMIKITKVIETYEWVKEETPYKNTYETDPKAELDTTSTLVPGQTGYVVTRAVSRFEDGEKTKTHPSQHWKASDPIDGVLGRGTLPVVKTEEVDGVTLEYWRKVSVYATSYKPSSFPPGARTRSGTPVMKGVIAVSAAWYPSMSGQRVYVPGYGHAVIGDSGGGISGRYWIDLGYDDASYIGWHHWTTLYFLTPIPNYIPAVLP